jgi:hypothetical protein
MNTLFAVWFVATFTYIVVRLIAKLNSWLDERDDARRRYQAHRGYPWR